MGLEPRQPAQCTNPSLVQGALDRGTPPMPPFFRALR